jgi:hypothetical protein
MRGVEQRLVETGRNLVRGMGGSRGAEATGRRVSGALDAKRTEMQRVTSGLYEQVRAESGDRTVGNLKTFRDFIDSPEVADNAAFDTMRQSLARRLARLNQADDAAPKTSRLLTEEDLATIARPVGSKLDALWYLGAKNVRGTPGPVWAVRDRSRGGEIAGWGLSRKKVEKEIGNSFNPDDLFIEKVLPEQADAELRQRAAELGVSLSSRTGGGTTIAQAEELRKFIGKLGSGIEPSVRRMRAKLIEALDDDVVGAVGDDAFKAARASARARFEEFQKTFPGKLADEGLSPELITKRVLGDGVSFSDIRAMRKSLTTGTPEQVARGKEAWQALRAQAVDDLLQKAVDADGNLVGTVLYREFSKNAAKYREILGPQDYKTLQRLAAASRDAKALPVGHSVNTSNTAITTANLFDNAPKAVRQGWLRLMGKIGLRAGAHAGAAAFAGPAGNVAVESARAAGGAAASVRAETAAVQALMRRIELAKSPEAAAAAINEARAAAASNPAVADALHRAGLGAAIGAGGGITQ